MGNEDKMTLTDGEMRILKAMFANMKSKPDVDWDTAAVAASLGNAKSIKERYRQMCVRLGWNNKEGSAGGTAPSTPKSTKVSPCKVVKRSDGGRKKKLDAVKVEKEKLDFASGLDDEF